MNTLVQPAIAALEDSKSWQPAADWTLLQGRDVEVHDFEGTVDQGRVDSVTADGTILWLLQVGAYPRRIIQKTP
ncbi:hypothetical protein [Arthrobacter sp. NPDC093139]|uniref:hypothetical protein n=1 Tax=Arthrobacter sp. NPDC093139 TaxID=3363945 RepID=UPI0038060A10